MKKEEIEELLQEVKYNLKGGYNEVLVETLSKGVYELIDSKETQLSETEEKLKRVYKEVLEDIYYDYTCPEYGGVTELCRYCEEEKGHKHDPDCLVLEAQTWLEDKE